MKDILSFLVPSPLPSTGIDNSTSLVIVLPFLLALRSSFARTAKSSTSWTRARVVSLAAALAARYIVRVAPRQRRVARHVARRAHLLPVRVLIHAPSAVPTNTNDRIVAVLDGQINRQAHFVLALLTLLALAHVSTQTTPPRVPSRGPGT